MHHGRLGTTAIETELARLYRLIGVC
jgi:hypothetical protein